MSGKKYDEGKIRYDLIPPEAKRAMASQLAFGADKYGDRNWEQGLHFSRLVRAAEGHLTDWWAGEDFDEEERPHLYGAITSLAMLLALVERYPGTEFDNRPIPPVNLEDLPDELPSWDAYPPAKHAVLTYDPKSLLGFTFTTQDPPVEEVENSENLTYCSKCTGLYSAEVCPCYWENESLIDQAIAEDQNHPMHDAYIPEKTDQSTGEDPYIHKLTRHKKIMCQGLPKYNFMGQWHYHWHRVTCPECLELRA